MLRSLILLSKGPCGELLRMDKVNPVLSAKNEPYSSMMNRVLSFTLKCMSLPLYCMP